MSDIKKKKNQIFMLDRSTGTMCCSFAGMFINYLLYADDLVLLVPSTARFDKLLRICEKIGIS